MKSSFFGSRPFCRAQLSETMGEYQISNIKNHFTKTELLGSTGSRPEQLHDLQVGKCLSVPATRHSRGVQVSVLHVLFHFGELTGVQVRVWEGGMHPGQAQTRHEDVYEAGQHQVPVKRRSFEQPGAGKAAFQSRNHSSFLVFSLSIPISSYLCSGTCVSEMTMLWSMKMSSARRKPSPTALSAANPDRFSKWGKLKTGPSWMLNRGTRETKQQQCRKMKQ